jgi:hypothetical protein
MIRRLALVALVAWTTRWAAQIAAALIARRLPPRPFDPDGPAPGWMPTPFE